MAIYDQSYRRWEGDRNRPVQCTTVIVEAGIRAASTAFFRRKFPAMILTLSSFALFLFGLVVIFMRHYALTTPDTLPEELVTILTDREFVEGTSPSGSTIFFYFTAAQMVFVAWACLLMGSGLVANDRRTNALELYLSRPMTVMQYVMGKLLVVCFFVALVSLVPAVILILVQLLVSVDSATEVTRLLDLLWRTVVGGGVYVLVPSLLMLTASSMAEKARNAAVMWLGLLFLTDVIAANVLVEIFGNESFALFSFRFNLEQCLAAILRPSEMVWTSSDVATWKSALVLGAWMFLCVRTLRRRIRPVEIVA